MLVAGFELRLLGSLRIQPIECSLVVHPRAHRCIVSWPSRHRHGVRIQHQPFLNTTIKTNKHIKYIDKTRALGIISLRFGYHAISSERVFSFLHEQITKSKSDKKGEVVKMAYPTTVPSDHNVLKHFSMVQSRQTIHGCRFRWRHSPNSRPTIWPYHCCSLIHSPRRATDSFCHLQTNHVSKRCSHRPKIIGYFFLEFAFFWFWFSLCWFSIGKFEE